MKKIWLSAIFVISALLLAACSEKDDTTETTVVNGETLVYKSCSLCHGNNLEGSGKSPALNHIGAHMTEEEILNVIINGTGKGMPPRILEGEEAEKAAEWLSQQK